MRVVALVEGYGDVKAVPNLVSRSASLFATPCEMVHPIRAGEWKSLRREGQLERFLDLAASRAPDLILIILDLEDDCVAQEAAAARARVAIWLGSRSLKVETVFINREYETLFLQEPSCFNIPSPQHIPSNPEQVRGAKERIRQITGKKYKETQDQARFTQSLNLTDLFQASRAYRRLCKSVVGIDYYALTALL